MKTKTNYFYSHLIELDSIFAELENLELSGEEREELAELAHVQVHQAVVDRILSHLSDVDKKRFLELMILGEDEKIWEHLRDKVEKIDDKIKDAAKQIKVELKADIKKVKTS